MQREAHGSQDKAEPDCTTAASSEHYSYPSWHQNEAESLIIYPLALDLDTQPFYHFVFCHPHVWLCMSLLSGILQRPPSASADTQGMKEVTDALGPSLHLSQAPFSFLAFQLTPQLMIQARNVGRNPLRESSIQRSH